MEKVSYSTPANSAEPSGFAASSVLSIFMQADTTVLYWMRGIILIGLLQYLMDVTAQVLERFWQTVRQRAVGACKYFTVFCMRKPRRGEGSGWRLPRLSQTIPVSVPVARRTW